MLRAFTWNRTTSTGGIVIIIKHGIQYNTNAIYKLDIGTD
jgi:hypothetical protein